MAFREVSMNKIREVLRVWLGWPGCRPRGAHDRRALRYGPQDGAALRGGPRRHPVCPATTMSALSMTG